MQTLSKSWGNFSSILLPKMGFPSKHVFNRWKYIRLIHEHTLMYAYIDHRGTVEGRNSIYINPRSNTNFSEFSHILIWLKFPQSNVWYIHAQQPRQQNIKSKRISSPSKAEKTDSIFAQEIFFPLFSCPPGLVSYSIFIIIMLGSLNATASFHFHFSVLSSIWARTGSLFLRLKSAESELYGINVTLNVWQGSKVGRKKGIFVEGLRYFRGSSTYPAIDKWNT